MVIVAKHPEVRTIIEIDEETLKIGQIFHPGLLEKSQAAAADKTRFAYYTSADTAIKILANKEIWLRNTTVMNDFSEISYGLALIEKAFSSEVGDKFREAVEDIFDGTMKLVDQRYRAWKFDWEAETYITCISVHDHSEDRHGRLSMWRAYGDTAIVINNQPMTAVSDELGAFSVPVSYHSDDGYQQTLQKVTENILINRTFLKELGQDFLVDHIQHMLFVTAIATKHPAFAEEKEWRIYFRPSEIDETIIKRRIESVGGVPQPIYAIPLIHAPANGLHHADISSLLDRVIIGPTEDSYVVAKAFHSVLREQGIEEVENKVIISDIPLRT